MKIEVKKEETQTITSHSVPQVLDLIENNKFVSITLNRDELMYWFRGFKPETGALYEINSRILNVLGLPK